MSTRGVVGIYSGGVTKAGYNHSDSYPDGGIGEDIVEQCRKFSVEDFQKAFKRIKTVKNESGKPGAKQREHVLSILEEPNMDVGDRKGEDWYSVLHNAQGTLEPYVKGLKYMLDYDTFLKDGLSCEWGYIVNLDNNTLEIYYGHQKVSQANNRYAITNPEEFFTEEQYEWTTNKKGKRTRKTIGTFVRPEEERYWHCALLVAYPLDAIPENWLEQVKELEAVNDAMNIYCRDEQEFRGVVRRINEAGGLGFKKEGCKSQYIGIPIGKKNLHLHMEFEGYDCVKLTGQGSINNTWYEFDVRFKTVDGGKTWKRQHDYTWRMIKVKHTTESGHTYISHESPRLYSERKRMTDKAAAIFEKAVSESLVKFAEERPVAFEVAALVQKNNEAFCERVNLMRDIEETEHELVQVQNKLDNLNARLEELNDERVEATA